MRKKTLYLDYASSTPVDPNVLAAMMPYMKQEYGNPSSLHGFGQKA
ncbi:MAG TPA: aminotransferase class V-fold PLP-dependent enzyme, partial [Candidatus Paceibacterota bacterium]